MRRSPDMYPAECQAQKLRNTPEVRRMGHARKSEEHGRSELAHRCEMEPPCMELSGRLPLLVSGQGARPSERLSNPDGGSGQDTGVKRQAGLF